MPRATSERAILLLIGAVQFANILDFMMVMPLGPDFAKDLGIPLSHIGWIGGAYTASAAVTGILGGFFLDRFDRRPALAVAMLGLVVATAAGGLAWDLPSLLAARIAAGAFGGPATSLSLSIIADVVPPERRGRAMSAVMAAFAVASVLGVPFGLELSELAGWRTPFFAVAGLGLIIAVGVFLLLPSLRGHLSNRSSAGGKLGFIRNPAAITSLLSIATVTLAAFSLIPNVSAHMQFGYGYSRDHLGRLYMAGGACAFLAMPVIGRLTDRFGAPIVSAFGTFLFIAVLYFGFALPPFLPPMLVFVGFMMGMSFRNVPMTALSTRVPLPHERARFMSAQSAVQHMASSVGAFMGARMLTEGPDKQLIGLDRVAYLAMVIAIPLPFLMVATWKFVRAREKVAKGLSASPVVLVPEI